MSLPALSGTAAATEVAAFVPTAEQAAAIEAPLRPLLLVAGAGTGKTTVMARRILHLVRSGQARADQVLGLTFTNKAARHLKERVRAALGPNADVRVATYHSFGASLVADHHLELDLDPGTQVLNRAQSWQLLFTVFDEFRFERRGTLSPRVLLDDALALASRCADHLVPVEKVVADCHDVIANGRWKDMREQAAKRLELCQVVAAYERRKRERNLLDFGDQVALAVRLLAEHPEVAATLRQQHPVVLLDEYQDTNFAQRRLLQLLYPLPAAGGVPAAVTAVGDDMQSIYGFRGAHLANILRFGHHFPPADVLPLQTTFRFGPRLVELANRIQANVGEALKKELVAAKDAPATTIDCFLAADDAEEAATIADEVRARPASWGGTAVLCRKRRLIRPIVEALTERGVPVEVVGASGLLDRPEVVDLVAWLETLADLSSPVALLRILRSPRYAIGLRDLAALARHGKARQAESADADVSPTATGAGSGAGRRARGGALAEGLSDLAAVADLSAGARRRLEEFCRERARLARAAQHLPVLDLAETILTRTGLWRATDDRGRENLLRFLDLAARFSPIDGDPGLPAFVEYLQLLDESDEDVAEAHRRQADAVTVMTVHQAKGLEFDVVYVPGLAGRGSSRIFPDARAGENALSNSSALPWWLREDDGIPSPRTASRPEIDECIKGRRLDEEWRLLYVAATRARHHLVLSAAHWYRGAAEPQGPSQFYDFVATQSDLVTERFRHEPATVDPEVAAKERHRAATAARYPGPVATDGGQLSLDDVGLATDPGSARPPALPRRAPAALSVSGMVTYARCPKQFFWTVVRPLPRRASAAARLGTEVHRWIQQRSGRQLSLIEPESDADLDPDALPPDSGLAERLKASFLASPWAELDPVRVEAPFVLSAGSHQVRGRIDAVYQREGRLELVDFKTGRPASAGDPSAGVQLDIYGLAAIDTWRADPARLRTSYCWLQADGPPVVESLDWAAGTVERVRAGLVSTLDDVAAGRYAPTPGAWCRGCDFLSVCPAGQARLGAPTEAGAQPGAGSAP
ncbi:MAG TPA: ATP-dependent DNA helicase [Acidimicrobiales bacterium]|nr:ATP-dependent DNA helicase [Acidimicrobiales bacterium]